MSILLDSQIGWRNTLLTIGGIGAFAIALLFIFVKDFRELLEIDDLENKRLIKGSKTNMKNISRQDTSYESILESYKTIFRFIF